MAPSISLPLEPDTDYRYDSPGFSGSDTGPVTTPSPSRLAYETNSESEVSSVVPLPPNLVGDHAKMSTRDTQLTALAEEAKKFFKCLAVEVCHIVIFSNILTDYILLLLLAIYLLDLL